MIDIYQERYLNHQAKKKEILVELMEERHSERMFADQAVEDGILQDLLKIPSTCPSSCDRQGITVSVERERDRKALLGGVLVGGVGWIHRAPVVLMFWGDPVAYKAGDEWKWNPFIDAGMVAYATYLYVIASDMKCCFVNPQVRDFNRQHFQQTFSPFYGPEDWDLSPNGIFCGAIAIGYSRESGYSDGGS